MSATSNAAFQWALWAKCLWVMGTRHSVGPKWADNHDWTDNYIRPITIIKRKADSTQLIYQFGPQTQSHRPCIRHRQFRQRRRSDRAAPLSLTFPASVEGNIRFLGFNESSVDGSSWNPKCISSKSHCIPKFMLFRNRSVMQSSWKDNAVPCCISGCVLCCNLVRPLVSLLKLRSFML